ncbi:hypothetical protein TcBrA4_0065080 [Trypanosoma cruzi]|nr:hypothetical protein TcBrA4_0065080 [Trypanosoma cruzi]
MSGTRGGANVLVEDLEVLLEGDTLPPREPFMRRGRPPSKRKPKLCEMMPEFGTVTTAVVDGLEGTLSNSIDGDGIFTMRPRFRKDVEMDKQKQLIANAGLVAQTLTTDSLPPVGPVAPLKKEMERSSFYISGEETRIGLQASGFCMQKAEKEVSFSPLTEPTPCKQPAFEELRNDYGVVDAGCFFHSKYCFNDATRPTRSPESLRLQRHLHSPTLYDETTDIFEDVDDFISGSPFKRDLCLPAPQYARNPPKSCKRQVRLCAFSSILIPSSSLPGTTVDDTVDSSLVRYGSPVALQRDDNSLLPNHSTAAFHDEGANKEPKKLPSESTPSKQLGPLGLYPFFSSSGTHSFFWDAHGYYGDFFEA